jgi:monothiol glutaredoxin
MMTKGSLMNRIVLEEKDIHAGVAAQIGGGYEDTLKEVISAVAAHDLVVVGMAQNPVCKKVRKNLEAAGLKYHYLEYGSYFKEWHRRLVLKMWSGFKTFPMVFVKGQLIGGNSEVEKLIASGEMKQLLASPRA